MIFSNDDRPSGRGYASAVLLWFVVAVAAAHGFLGAVSSSRGLRLQADNIGTAGQRAGDPAGERTTLTNQQRLVAIADWRGLALKSLLAGGDVGPAILPETQWCALSGLRHCLSGAVLESLDETWAMVQRARAPPQAA